MRGFIVLCLAAVALAAPQGYNYNNPGSAVAGGFSTASGSGAAFFQGGQQQHAVAQQHFQQQPAFAQQQVGGHSYQQHGQQQQAIVSKRFFIHSAPEESDDQFSERHITVGVPKRNYNVVFIKSPQRSNKKTSIKISPAVNEDKTVIYVLSKKTDSSDVHAEVVEQASSTSKPEVFFIKYKTNEEAQHAQQQIQAQYDSLGGTSQLTDEGVAPVTSVIGALGGGDAGSAVGGTGFGSSGSYSSSHQGGGISGGAISGGAISGGGISGGGISGHGVSGHTGNAYLPPNF
ncbi:keratin, type I cytoskeletal 10 [Drosophila grimshawi]|uniref:GH19057 n=1 Tax=Drosophila grimshawi TaxID=7222 RepID=B4JS18_DROGR|nr:keratin, type I cytoskeletal 10 [Drosophila grimshawi]EDV94558.1 GH19057 [Drosophila grimshawi]